jgi:site-specific DNA recombinase
MGRVPAQAIEDLVRDRLIRIVGKSVRHDWAMIRGRIDRVVLREDELAIRLAHRAGAKDPAAVAERLPPGDRVERDNDLVTITVPVRLKFRGGAVRLIASFGRSAIGQRPPDPALTKAIASAHVWRVRFMRGDAQSIADLAKAERVTEAYVRRRLRLAFLAPDVTRAILDGRQPPGLTLRQILNGHWQAQRRLFGFDQTAESRPVYEPCFHACYGLFRACLRACSSPVSGLFPAKPSIEFYA